MMRASVSCFVLLGLLLHLNVPANACGQSTFEPIFVFEGSPDLPFKEFAAGKIGIVKSTFGRKTLLIAYRYLNGGSFTTDEQEELVEALEGKAPEDEGGQALKEWLAIRKEYLHEQELPDIYAERKLPFGDYDFFPNCAKNSFETASTTLKARVAIYGAADPNVREWVRGQDEVFQNCSGGPTMPRELGPEAAVWLRKDREYQIAAALFYSLQLDQARARFQKIAADSESDWHTTAEYLVARTLVRQASLTEDEKRKGELYTEAERYLEILLAKSNQFRDASRKLMSLVKYRFHPVERVGELAERLGRNNASEDLRQEVIDYVWLLDKFEGQILAAERKRLEALKEKDSSNSSEERPAQNSTWEAVARGELISIMLAPKMADGNPDYRNHVSIQVKPDLSEAEIIRLVEEGTHRKLLPEEVAEVKTQIKSQLEHRQWRISQNRKLDGIARDHGGCPECYDLELGLKDLPTFLTANDLSDWILTFQIEGPDAFARAVAKWRETESPAWLLAALTKAQTTSPSLDRLIQAAERNAPDSAAFPTITFHLVRLKIALGKTSEAQQQLDKLIATQFDLLPVSAQNQFREQRLHLSRDVSEFFKFAARKPAAFWGYRIYRTIEELIEERKAEWSAEYYEESKDEYASRIERKYRDLVSSNLALFDESTADVLDRHFSLQMLVHAAQDPVLSSYLRLRLALVVWTRAVLLKEDQFAIRIAPEVIKAMPELSPLMSQYLEAKNSIARSHAALYILLKFPGLRPFVAGSMPEFSTAEEADYYLESAWWCKPSETEYRDGEEVRKVVPAPAFLDRNQLATAHREYNTLAALGEANSYLAKLVLEWAAKTPNDPRIPEALFIAIKANESYKYGCNGWQHDQELQEKAKKLLLERYPQSLWAAKLN